MAAFAGGLWASPAPKAVVRAVRRARRPCQRQTVAQNAVGRPCPVVVADAVAAASRASPPQTVLGLFAVVLGAPAAAVDERAKADKAVLAMAALRLRPRPFIFSPSVAAKRGSSFGLLACARFLQAA